METEMPHEQWMEALRGCAQKLSADELAGPSNWISYTIGDALDEPDLWCDFSAAGYTPEKALKEVLGD